MCQTIHVDSHKSVTIIIRFFHTSSHIDIAKTIKFVITNALYRCLIEGVK